VAFVVGARHAPVGTAPAGRIGGRHLCEGGDVELAGVIPTPGVATLAKLRNAPGVMISASHNLFEDTA